MSGINDRRIGRFTVSVDLINDNPDGVRTLLAHVIVLQAETVIWDDTIAYVAICDSFDVIGEGAIVPTYKPWLTARFDDIGNVISAELTRWEKL